MQVLEILSILIMGWVAGAESGSWLCVHPVIARLPANEEIAFQKGLLKTFGRVMPVLMPLSLVLVIAGYIGHPAKASTSGLLQLISCVVLGSAIVTTVLFNVPVNAATGRWKDGDHSKDWQRKRKLWRFFQGYRALAFIVVFALLVIAMQTP